MVVTHLVSLTMSHYFCFCFSSACCCAVWTHQVDWVRARRHALWPLYLHGRGVRSARAGKVRTHRESWNHAHGAVQRRVTVHGRGRWRDMGQVPKTSPRSDLLYSIRRCTCQLSGMHRTDQQSGGDGCTWMSSRSWNQPGRGLRNGVEGMSQIRCPFVWGRSNPDASCSALHS